MTTVRALLTAATVQLRSAGIGSPRVDAELLLAHALDIDRSRLPLVDGVPRPAEAAFTAAVDRRARREPLQHIVGQAPFRHIVVAVGPGVFVPAARDRTARRRRAAHAARQLPTRSRSTCARAQARWPWPSPTRWRARGSMRSRVRPAALAWLARNAAGTGVEVVPGDVRDPDLLAGLRGTVDAVVCNPPYVPAATVVSPRGPGRSARRRVRRARRA